MGRVKQLRLIKKGAEASLYLMDWHNRKVVVKRRLPKKYRPPKLDEQIRTYRTVHEPQLLHEAKKAGVPTPLILSVDVKNASIIMEFIDGKQLKQLLSNVSGTERRRLCLRVGESIGKLHERGIVHGDLTTSNMILNAKGRIFFVDFGLGEKTEELEARAVDLHLMKRALQSTHFRFAKECFDAVMEGYTKAVSLDSTRMILEKISEIERRGRYVAERKAEVA
jgi:TP53 regulating kinase-like protein